MDLDQFILMMALQDKAAREGKPPSNGPPKPYILLLVMGHSLMARLSGEVSLNLSLRSLNPKPQVFCEVVE
jgi:hypothetical protein